MKMVVPTYRDGYSHRPVYTNEMDSSVNAVDSKQKFSEDMEQAVKNIEQFITVDNSFPELADRLKIRPGTASKSGLYEQEYPGSTGPFAYVTQLKSISKVPIPNEIMEHFSRIHCHSMMGTFAEIRRAWLVVDSDLFLWDFEYGSDVAYFDGVSEIIISVGLVKPKPGVFQDFVHYLLILTTPSNIVVLGVTFSKPNDSFTASEEMHITQEVVYTLPTDGVVFSTIVGTTNGRIFMGAKDGCLYEFLYQKEISWWGKRCRKVNHSSSTLSVLIPSFLNVFNEIDALVQISVDDSRHVLYTLSAKGSIEMYDLGENGQSMSKIASYNHNTILNYVVRIMEESCLFGPVISISAIEVYDSVHIALVAVMESGTRIYFSCTGGHRPASLHIAHVRMPPGYTGSTPAQRPTKVRTALCSRGTCLLINSNEGCQDKLWCLSSDLTPFSPLLSETLSIAALDGPVWSLERCNYNALLTSTIPEPPVLVTQHYELATKYACLTDKGSEIFQKLRPVDVVREILEEGHDPGSEAVRCFFQTLSEDEICATLLLLACQKTGNEQISDIATRGFFLYGGEPKIVNAAVQISSPSSPFHQTLPAGFNPSSVSTPIGQRGSTSPVTIDHQPTMQFSHKHNGLYLYLCRTMRPVWYARVIHSLKCDNKIQWIIPSILIDRAVLVCSHLLALASFLDINPNVTAVPALPVMPRGMANDSIMGTPNNRRLLQELYVQEKKSLLALKSFVSRASEVLNLWKMLFDHQFNLVAATLSPEELTYLSSVTFGDLILSGSEMCNTLISKLLNLYLDDNSSVDAISTKLRDVCPTLFLIEDAACAKAIEMIMFSRAKADLDEKQKLLEDSLKMLKEVAPKINLSAICSQYQDVGFFVGIYELCQLTAKKLDPKDLALHYYRNGGLAFTPEQIAYTQRMSCYKELTSALEYLYHKQSAGRGDNTTPPIISSFSNASAVIQQDQMRFQEFLDLCLSSKDELLHCAIYEWMMNKKLHGELVSFGHPSLEFFLQQSHTSQQFASHDVKEILWMFFEKQGNHNAAANILFNLAKETNDNITLEQRIHYLSHSLVCMKSNKSGAAPLIGVLFQEVEDNLQVAQIQLKIQKILSNSVTRKPGADAAVRTLNSKLFNLTELYENYADPFDLWECKLEIIDCSNTPAQNNDVVHEIWENIIAEEIQKCVSSNPNDKMASVTRKIKSILLSVRQQSPVFTIEFLIFHLELVSCRLGASKNHVHAVMNELGIPIQKITDVYEELYVVNSSRWEENGDEYHIIAAIGSFADSVVRSTNITQTQKKQTALKLNDLITHCLNMLYSRQTNSRLAELIRWLKVVQDKLNRI
ncbi:nuclear pore complex protein Nup155 isoform X2 [Planococcus citri]|uniref:nuclear pore complex protein Nup155 isoform X2 n=1 Tax=Planococcus citri TaxID=170843 RepID=UPI0031F7BC32